MRSQIFRKRSRKSNYRRKSKLRGGSDHNQHIPTLSDFHFFINNGWISEASDVINRIQLLNFNINSPDINGNTPLMLACNKADSESSDMINLIQLLLFKNADLNISNNNGDTPLLFSIYKQNLYLINLLLQSGANPNQISQSSMNEQITPLIKSISWQYLDIIKILLENGADPNLKIVSRNVANNTSFHYISFINIKTVKIFKLLLEHGGNPNNLNSNNESIWHNLNNSKQLEKFMNEVQSTFTVKTLNAKRKIDGNTVLHLSIKNVELCKLLINKGVDPNIKNDRGQTCLHLLFDPFTFKDNKGTMELVKLILKNGGKPNIQNNEGDSPLHLMFQFNCIRKDYFGLLLSKGFNPNLKNNNGSTPFMVAIMTCDLGSLKILLHYKADIKIKDNSNLNILHLLAIRGDVKIFNFFLDKNVLNINDKTIDGANVFHIASMYRHLDIIKKLLSTNINIHVKTKEGQNALHLAFQLQGFYDIVDKFKLIKLLLSLKFDINALDNNKKTPLMYSYESDEKFLFNLLLENGADPNIQYLDKDTLLFKSVNDNPVIFKLLLDNDADPNIPNSKGETLLFNAAKEGNAELIKLLLMYNADTEIMTWSDTYKQNLYPIQIANKEGFSECETLLEKPYKQYNFLKK